MLILVTCLALIVWSKSKAKVYLSDCLLTPPALLCLCWRNLSIVFQPVLGVASMLVFSGLPSPAQPSSIKHNSPETICMLLADWPGEGPAPQAVSTNGDRAAWLIGRGQVASLHFCFFSCFKQQPLHCRVFSPSCVIFFCFVSVRKRRESGHFTALRTFPPHLNTSWIIPSFTFLLSFFSPNGRCDRLLFDRYNGSCHPNPVSLRSVMNNSHVNFLLSPIIEAVLVVMFEANLQKLINIFINLTFDCHIWV